MNSKKINEAYADGFKSGLNWSDAWESHGKPGGPWVPSKVLCRNSFAVYEQCAAERTAWLKGWEIGHCQKITTKRVNPLVGTDENARHHANGEAAAEANRQLQRAREYAKAHGFPAPGSQWSGWDYIEHGCQCRRQPSNNLCGYFAVTEVNGLRLCHQHENLEVALRSLIGEK